MLSFIDFRKYQASDSYIQDLSSSTKLGSVKNMNLDGQDDNDGYDKMMIDNW